MKQIILEKLNKEYNLKKIDMQDLSEIKDAIMRFHNETYKIEGVGNLFIMEMNTIFNLMKMQVIVITPQYKDLSFVNFDIINAFSNETALIELYKSSIDEPDLTKLNEVKEKYKSIKEYPLEKRWYDEFRLDCSITKKDKKEIVNSIKYDYLDAYLDVLRNSKDCDYNLKQLKNSDYVNKLIDNGGVAVDSLRKKIGKEKTDLLVKKYMFNICE